VLQKVLFWSKPFSVLGPMASLLVGAVTAMPGPGNLFPIDSTAFAQQTSLPSTRRPIAFPTSIQWAKQRGVTKYRLQIADDEKFSNIFYDGPVVGERYTVTGLAPGYYYWRIAPSERQTGAFLKGVRFFVSGGVVIPVMPSGSPVTRPRLPAMPASRIR
jgi:hypothetical protein